MRTQVINSVLKGCQGYQGCFARDQLPKYVFLPCAVVVNTDTSEEPGTHWVSIYINENGEGIYMDSLGLPPLYEEISEFLSANCRRGYNFNRTTVQAPVSFSITCGHYCILFASLLCRGYSFSDFLSLFSTSSFLNEVLVRLYTEK